MRTFILILATLLWVGCAGEEGKQGPPGPSGSDGQNGSNGQDGNNGQNGNGNGGGTSEDQEPPEGVTVIDSEVDNVFASSNCEEKDNYSTLLNQIWVSGTRCWSNGNRKITYNARGDGETYHSFNITCYEMDGIQEKECHPIEHDLIEYFPDYIVVSYYDAPNNREIESYFLYQSNTKINRYRETFYYESNGNKERFLEYKVNSGRICPPSLSHYTTDYCSPNPASNQLSKEITYFEDSGYRERYIQYATDGITKTSETTYFESNGYQKNHIYFFQGDKSQEQTFYENTGYRKVTTNFYTAGANKGNASIRTCYDIDGKTTETCNLSKHGVEPL